MVDNRESKRRETQAGASGLGDPFCYVGYLWFSNRQIPQVELLLSDWKQRSEPPSNRQNSGASRFFL